MPGSGSFASESKARGWLAGQEPEPRAAELAVVPRRFVLQRHEDVTGASGTGLVAWGVLWPDGTASVRWAGERASAVFWQGGIADVEFVHGHNGATDTVWLDEGA